MCAAVFVALCYAVGQVVEGGGVAGCWAAVCVVCSAVGVVCSAVGVVCSAVDVVCSAVGVVCSAVGVVCSAVGVAVNIVCGAVYGNLCSTVERAVITCSAIFNVYSFIEAVVAIFWTRTGDVFNVH